MAGRRSIILAVLPFASPAEPVLGVSLLKAAAEREGFCCRIRYFNLDFAKRIGIELYNEISRVMASRSLLGDWLFAEALFGRRLPDASEYVDHLLADYSRWEDGIPYGVDFGKYGNFTGYLKEKLVPEVLEARKSCLGFVNGCAEEILAGNPWIVGFTSSCHQACSCLAVARRLKSEAKAPIVVFGGPNCHEELGWNWLEAFPWIDYVCTGEGDEVFPEFLRTISRRSTAVSIPGIIGRGQEAAPSVPPSLVELDRAPIPDYSDYFRQLGQSSIRREIGRPRLPIETSRGCWWGERKQCVFCGNHRTGIRFRSKSPRRVLREMSQLRRRHRFGYFLCVDDSLDRKHIGRVFPRLARNKSKIPIYYQARPNLSRRDLRAMAAGGVRILQPGIESLSDHVLRLMHKGTTGLQNIQLLKWCEEAGMNVSWRILYGFPGEPEGEYERMAALIPLLTHLPPPISCGPIALKRFSPYWREPGAHGLMRVRPWASYSHIFPLAPELQEGIAYFFDFDYADGRQPFEYSRELRREAGRWIMLWQGAEVDRPRLDLHRQHDRLVITDTRPSAIGPQQRLKGLPAKLYLYCDRARSLEDLVRRFGADAPKKRILEVLRRMVGRRLMIEDTGRFLALAVRRENIPA